MRILAIYGDFYHAAAPYDRALKKVLDNAPFGKDTIVQSLYYPTVFPIDVLADLDLLILCKEGVIPGRGGPYTDRWVSPDTENAIATWVERGGTLFGWHSGLASYDPNGPIHAIYKGRFNGHPPVHEFTIEKSDKSESLKISDELYTMTTDPDSTHVTWFGHSPENGTQPVSWEHDHGKGRVYCFTLSHFMPVLALDPIQTELTRIIGSPMGSVNNS